MDAHGHLEVDRRVRHHREMQVERLSEVVFESGGNTGAALTEYGQKAGLETFLFIPEENVSLLDQQSVRTRESSPDIRR